MVIQPAKLEHAEAISHLMDELGYNATATLIENNLQFIAKSEFDQVFVAISDGKVIGAISCHLTTLFHVSGMCGRITSLVVSSDIQNGGVGKALVARADKYFIENGCVKAEVTSGDHRVDAHRFYEKQGYLEDERRFIKLY